VTLSDGAQALASLQTSLIKIIYYININ